MNEPNRNPDAELDALFALARTRRPGTSKAEFAFETRLMARLNSRQDTNSVFAIVSWRLIPFFAACVVALTIWQAQVASEANIAVSVAGLNYPVAAEVGGN